MPRVSRFVEGPDYKIRFCESRWYATFTPNLDLTVKVMTKNKFILEQNFKEAKTRIRKKQLVARDLRFSLDMH